MDKSIAGTRALTEPGQAVVKTLGDARANISTENARTKSNALNEYASRKTAYNEGLRGENNAAKTALIGGLGEAGMTGYMASRNPELYDYGQYGSAGVYELTRSRDRAANTAGEQRPDVPPDMGDWTEAKVREFASRNKLDVDELLDLWATMPTGGGQ
jgi:hypothetical protein